MDMTPKLSVLIPSRNEEWLNRTVADCLIHTGPTTEIIVVCDGAWPDQPIPQDPRLQVVFLPTAMGQRASVNLAARMSEAPFIMKLDAHCSLADGCDRVLLEAAATLGPDVVQVPAQKNLHAYDWVCRACGRREYQCGLTACRACNSPDLIREMVWTTKRGSTTTRWAFDSELRFQYWHGGPKDDFTETMSCLGACWFQSREQFLRWGGLDEAHGSWGQVGTELGCKTWLSGGKLLTNHKTWFAHFFRVGGHSIPYPLTGSEQEAARTYSRNMWRANKWPQQMHSLKWLVEKFQPHGWTEEQIHALNDSVSHDRPVLLRAAEETGGDGVAVVTLPPMVVPAVMNQSEQKRAGIIYYSDGRLDIRIASAARKTIERLGLPIVAITLGHLEWDAATLVVPLAIPRGYLTLFRQMLIALELSDADYIFCCEHDCLYPVEHILEAPRTDQLTYNEHAWKVRESDGHALHYRVRQTSGLSGPRDVLLEHYRTRVAIVERQGFSRNMGFEPGTHGRPQRVDDLKAGTWASSRPIVDIRHTGNLTGSRWRKEQFRNQKYTAGWTEAESVPGWGRTAGRFQDFLTEVRGGASLEKVA